MALRASAADFVPFAPFAPMEAKEPKYEEDEEYSPYPPYIDLDLFIYDVLPKLTHQEYYIKGGKAFQYYYPETMVGEHIPTSDFDLVATNAVCDELFEILRSLLGHVIVLDALDTLDASDMEPFVVERIHTTDEIWKDRLPGKKKKVAHRVRSFSVNDIGIVDVIIHDRVDPSEYEVSKGGIHMMERAHFRADLEEVYVDRKRKVGYFKDEPTSDRYQKSLRKFMKTKQRQDISMKYKGKRKSKRSRS